MPKPDFSVNLLLQHEWFIVDKWNLEAFALLCPALLFKECYPLIFSFIFYLFSLYFMCGRAWYCWVLIWCNPAIFMCRQFELWTPVSLRWHWSEWPDTTDQSQTTVWSEEGVSQSVRFIIRDNKLRKYIEQVAIVKMIFKDIRN